MATRRRTTRSGTSGRSSRSGSRYRSGRSRSSGYRRRRPRVATTLGSAFALAVVAAWLKLPWWPGRALVIGAVLLVIVLWGLWFLWSRRGDIYDEMQARKDSGQQ